MRIKAIVIIAVLFGTVFIIGGSAQTGLLIKHLQQIQQYQLLRLMM
jgi:lipid-binding SYLF domain-containing protein